MDAKQAGFCGKTKLNQIRVGTKEDIGISISPWNNNMLLWLDDGLYYQNNSGRLFFLDFVEVPIKKQIKE